MYVCTCIHEYVLYISVLLFSLELNDQTNVCISMTTESNIAAITGGVSAGLIFILVITILLVHCNNLINFIV